nr:translation initiation factor IF-2-like [Aegilops tauschii subsp. strangulata]
MNSFFIRSGAWGPRVSGQGALAVTGAGDTSAGRCERPTQERVQRRRRAPAPGDDRDRGEGGRNGAAPRRCEGGRARRPLRSCAHGGGKWGASRLEGTPARQRNGSRGGRRGARGVWPQQQQNSSRREARATAALGHASRGAARGGGAYRLHGGRGCRGAASAYQYAGARPAGRGEEKEGVLTGVVGEWQQGRKVETMTA